MLAPELADTRGDLGDGRIGSDPRNVRLVFEPRHLPLGELPRTCRNFLARLGFCATAVEHGEGLGITDRLLRGGGELREFFAQLPRFVEEALVEHRGDSSLNPLRQQRRRQRQTRNAEVVE